VLTDLLDTLRMSTLVYGRFELAAPWGIRLPDTSAAHLIVVARGGVHLEVAGVDAPLALSAGDLALLPHGGAHTLRSARGAALAALGGADCERIRRGEPIRIGGSGARTSLVIGTFTFHVAHRSVSIQRLARAIHVAANDPATPPGLGPAALSRI